MITWLKALLPMVIFAIVVLLAYNLIKPFLLSKLKINKWIVLVLALFSLLLPNLLMAIAGINPQNNPWLVWIPSGAFILFFLWFMDLSGFKAFGGGQQKGNTSYLDKRKNKKDIVIKPKAKPNRVKNKND